MDDALFFGLPQSRSVHANPNCLARVLAELGEEDEFDRAIAASAGKLATLANETIAEHRAGQTKELNPEQL